MWKQNKEIYYKLMYWGHCSGCHQLSERSFVIKGYQFPVCARCTGVLIGYIGEIISHFVFGTSLFLCLAGCLVMFADWFIQYLGIKQSTNIRRLITGVLGGYGVMGIQILCFSVLIELLLKLI